MPHGFVGSIGHGSSVICANDYSYLKATIGSTRIARRAGM
jgi:hypothetical protein